MIENRSESRPKVLLVSPGPVDGYPPVQYQVELFQESGWDVILLTCPRLNESEVEFACGSARIVSSPIDGKYRLTRLLRRAVFALKLLRLRVENWRALRAEISFDVEGVFFSRACWFKRRDCLAIAHLHEALIDPKNRALERLASRSLHKFDRIVVADRRRAELLQSQLDLESRPMDIPNYPMLRSESEHSRTDATPCSFRVGYAGSIGMHQGFNAIVRSITKWRSDATLHLLGNPATIDVKRIMKLAEELGVRDRIFLEGLRPVAEVVPFLSSCHLGLTLLCPIHDQWRFAAGASNKRYQCMQAGIPQVTDRNPGVPELIEYQGVGFCVDPNDPEAIADAVNFYIENEDQREAAGRKAVELQRTKYHYAIPFSHLLEWIDEASSRRRGVTVDTDPGSLTALG